MKNSILLGLAIGAASLLPLDLTFAAPTRDVMQPGRGLDVAQENCPKYAGDETREIACVLFHAGAVKKVSGQYLLNIPMLQLTEPNPVPFVKCKAEMIYLPDGSIGWKETGDCH